MGEGVRYGEQISDAPALLYAALLGPLTVAAPFICFVAVWERSDWCCNPDYSAGYYVGAGLSYLAGLALYGVFSGLITLFALLVFGRPVANLLGFRLLRRLWVLFAVGYGGIAGGLFSLLALGLLGFDTGTVVLGVPFGAATGFWYWFFFRRVLIARAAQEAAA